MIELKPCPFCGCTDIYLTFRQDHWDGEKIPIVFCNHCKVSVEAEDDAPSMNYEERYKWLEDKVTKVWNRRAPYTED